MTDAQDNTDKKRKTASDAATTLRTENMTSGEILRAAREKKKLSVEDISSAIHVRASQIRAIEEGNIDALPGMTYAVGFVKSYAGYLKLNAVDLGNKFKAEHGALKPLMPDLPEPKPIVESRMPDPMVVGVAAFCALVLLLGWTFFSGGDDAEDVTLTSVAVETAPPEMAAQNVTDEVTGEVVAASEADATSAPEEVVEAPVKAEEKEVKEAAKAPAETAAEKREAEEKAEEPAEKAVATETVSEEAAEAPAVAPLLPEKKPDLATLSEEAPVTTTAETINIRKAGRIVFKARNPSWVQVSDANERVVYKRLMKPGEQYTVPEGKGYTLITTNAGGFDVIVDGKTAPALGKQGEILRALPLEPSELVKEKRVKSRINN